MPGAAANLDDEIRESISPIEMQDGRWLLVHREAHRLGLRTTATMMVGVRNHPPSASAISAPARFARPRRGGFYRFHSMDVPTGTTELAQRNLPD